MLEIYYTDPPNIADGKKPMDISTYVTGATWSGDHGQAARRLDFGLAYNTEAKDQSFPAIFLLLGGTIEVYYSDETQPRVEIFVGRLWYCHRNTAQYTYEYTAYDNMIYLAKSKIYKVFQGITVSDALVQICQGLGVPMAQESIRIPTKVNFVADGKSVTEVIKTLQEMTRADTGGATDFSVVSLRGQITVVPKGQLITGYTATDEINVIHTEHAQSIEDMVSRVEAVDETGKVVQVYSVQPDIDQYGIVRDIYSIQPPKKDGSVDNTASAKARLRTVKEESSLEGVGNIQCITGYGITIQEEQLKGNFAILADTHKFDHNIHTMSLTLEYMPDNPEELAITEIQP